MKLIGSLSEAREREELVESNARLRGRQHPAAAALQARGVDLASSYILEWIPEQAEDLFVVLAGSDRVVRVEITRATGSLVAAKDVPLAEYAPQTKPARLRLAVALELVRSSAPGAAQQAVAADDPAAGKSE